jgi:hypothetical protein
MATGRDPTHRGVDVVVVGRRGTTQPDGDARSGDRTRSRWDGGSSRNGGRVALSGDALGLPPLGPGLARTQPRAATASRRRWARGIRARGRLRRCRACGGDQSGPGLALRAKLLTVGEAHKITVPRGLKVQVPEADFEPGWEGVRATHAVASTTVLSADHHGGSWRNDLRRSFAPR